MLCVCVCVCICMVVFIMLDIEGLTDQEALLRMERGILRDILRPAVSRDDIDIAGLGDDDLLHEGSDGMDRRGLWNLCGWLGTQRRSSDRPLSKSSVFGEGFKESEEGLTEKLLDRNRIGDVLAESDMIIRGDSISLAWYHFPQYSIYLIEITNQKRFLKSSQTFKREYFRNLAQKQKKKTSVNKMNLKCQNSHSLNNFSVLIYYNQLKKNCRHNKLQRFKDTFLTILAEWNFWILFEQSWRTV